MTKMKKVIFTAFAALLLSAFAPIQQPAKKFKFEFEPAEISKHVNKLQAIQKIVDASSLPHDQVKFVIGSIDSLLFELEKQVRDTSINSLN